MLEYITKNLEWFNCMQVGLGHHSWWYTNRRPSECIDVKVRAWIDQDKVLEKLTANDKKIIETLGIDLKEWLNELVWGDYGMVSMAKENLLEALKEKYNVTSVEYGGKSGGWLAVVYSWNDVHDDFDSGEYSYSDIRKFYSTIKKALAEHEKVTAEVLERKRNLEKDIENPENYIENIQESLSYKLENEQSQAQKVLGLTA